MSNYSLNIWFDGCIIPFNEAKIHVMSHCIHYGSGVFEGIKCYDTPNGPAIFRLEDHIKRLHSSASAFKMKIPFSVKDLCQASIDLVRANRVKNCYIRPVAFYGFDTLGVHPKGCPVQASIATLDWGAYISKEALMKGFTVVDAPTIISTHLSETIRKYSEDIITRQYIVDVIDALKKKKGESMVI